MKAAMMLAGAVVCGVGAMVGVRQVLSGKGKPEAMRSLLVASRDVKVEEIIKPDMVKVTQVPASGVPSGSFASYEDVADRWASMPLLAGEPFLEGKLAPKGAPIGLLPRIPTGMRALAIEVNEHTGVSGFVLPDHRVDVILAREKSSGHDLGPTQPRSETILQDVLVLAAGNVTTRPEDKSILVRTVTLAVTPAEVDILVAARSHGSLSLSLRGLNDRSRVAKAPPPAPAVKTEPVVRPATKPPEPPAPAVVARAPDPPRAPERRLTIFHGPHFVERIAVGRHDPAEAPREAGLDRAETVSATTTRSLPNLGRDAGRR